jgi:hypothetical protein
MYAKGITTGGVPLRSLVHRFDAPMEAVEELLRVNPAAASVADLQLRPGDLLVGLIYETVISI